MLLVAGAANLKGQTGDELIRKHIDAIGGYKNWEKITSMRMIGALTVQGTDIAITQTIVNEKSMRMDISVMGMNGYTIITPTAGWVYLPFQPGMDKVKPIPPNELKASQDKMNLKYMQLVDKSQIAKAEFSGMDSVNSVSCYKVKITDKDGNVQTTFFDAATYYLVRTSGIVKTEGIEQEVGVNFSNFQKLPEGITMAMTWSSPEGDFNFKSIEVNKTYADSLFRPSAEDLKK